MNRAEGYKLLIVSLNSSYIHMSLAAWRLKAAIDFAVTSFKISDAAEYSSAISVPINVKVAEYTINDSMDSILRDIYFKGADAIAFSCYIWNIEYITCICTRLRELMPEVLILFGGPEVSYTPFETLEHCSFADMIICGEGETVLTDIIMTLGTNRKFVSDRESAALLLSSEKRNGVVIREPDGKIDGNSMFLIEDGFSGLPTPYTHEMLASINRRIAYVESARGCPFNCSYCLSSTFCGVRTEEMEKLKSELKLLINNGAPLIKFVDRTFNWNNARTIEIWEYICSLDTNSRFHFEVDPALLNAHQINVLKHAPKGRIQIEAGIQTMNPKALEAVNRRKDQRTALNNIKEVSSFGNVHVHVSLIAGLPFDNKELFINSVSDVFAASPQQIQLGFLKLLKGSKIRVESGMHCYTTDPYPPYTVYSNKWMDFKDISELKDVSFVIDNYWNSGRAKCLLTMAHDIAGLNFICEAAVYFRNTGYLEVRLSPSSLYEAMFKFIASGQKIVKPEVGREILLFDCLKKEGPRGIPREIAEIYTESDAFKKKCRDILENRDVIASMLPHYLDLESKKIIRKVFIKQFCLSDVTIRYIVRNGIIMEEIKQEGVKPEGNAQKCNKTTTGEQKKVAVLFDTGFRNCVTGLYNHIVLGTLPE